MFRTVFLSFCLFIIGANAHADDLKKITTIKTKSMSTNYTFGNNQIAFSTSNIPSNTSVTVYCQLNNYADFSGYLYVTAYSGSFSGINYQTCTTSGCGTASGSKVYLGLANTLIKIYGVRYSNQAVVLTNYSTQNLNVSCWF